MSSLRGRLSSLFTSLAHTQSRTMSTAARPYGAWPSPITADLTLTSSVGLGEVGVTPHGDAIAWCESRPDEKGRSAIVYRSLSSNSTEEVIPDQKWNARSRVHEYGGGSWTFGSDSQSIVFSNFVGDAYRVERGSNGSWGEPQQITPKSEVYRFADFDSHPTDPSLVLAVLEDHTNPAPADVQTSIVLIRSDTATLETVASGNDFYASPRWAPAGTDTISFHTWQHPSMPWDNSKIFVAKYSLSKDKMNVESPVEVPSDSKDQVAVSQPKWTLPSNEQPKLVFSSDRTGWQQLYRYSESSKDIKPLLNESLEEDVTPPDWTFGNSTHAALSESSWISTAPGGNLRIISLEDGSSQIVESRFVSISMFKVIDSKRIAIIASPAATPSVLSILTLPSSGSNKIEQEEIVKISSPAKVDPAYVSLGKSITFPTKDGSTGHAIFYPPASKDYTQGKDESELPPLITYIHGGPTSATPHGLSWSTQWWTSRGFAYVAVNYGGSTGYGSEYRKRLNGKWGIVDVEDTIACIEFLQNEGRIDPKRVAITGGSAGGYTVLATLTDSKVCTAGTSYYGVSDLKMLAEDTHKFESQYLFNLLGGTPAEVPENYAKRSPLNKASQITAPLLLLQGLDDKVVPPSQATLMLDKIRENPNAGKCDIELYEGEGHGFRSRDVKKRAMQRELKWYRDTWSIEGGDE